MQCLYLRWNRQNFSGFSALEYQCTYALPLLRYHYKRGMGCLEYLKHIWLFFIYYSLHKHLITFLFDVIGVKVHIFGYV